MMLDLVSAYWPILLSGAGFIIWLVRIEGKTINTEKRVDHLDQQVNQMDSALVKQLTEVKTSLARIEGILQGHREALRSD